MKHRNDTRVKKLDKEILYRQKALKTTKLLLRVVASVFVLAVLCATVVISSLFMTTDGRSRSVSVPNLIGQVYSEDMGYDSRFFTLDVGYEYSDSQSETAGTVISQSPSPGAVRKLVENERKCTLELTVSLGKKTSELSDLSGVDEREARNRLRCLGLELKINTVGKYSDIYGIGDVISTSPAAGEALFVGDEVTLFVSLGKRVSSVSLPDLIGMSETAANATLLAHGLQVGEVIYCVSGRPVGTVISQSPAKTATVSVGTKVNLKVSSGLYYNSDE